MPSVHDIPEPTASGSPSPIDAVLARRYLGLGRLMLGIGIGAVGVAWTWWLRGEYLPNVGAATIVAFLLGMFLSWLAGGLTRRSEQPALLGHCRVACRLNLFGLLATALTILWLAGSDVGDTDSPELDEIDPQLQQRMTQTIEVQRPEDWPALLRSSDPRERLAAIKAMDARAGRLSFPEVSAALLTAMQESQPGVCVAAIDMTGRYGPAAYPAMERLLTLACDDSSDVAGHAVLAMLQIAPHHLCEQDDRVLPHLINATHREYSPEICRNAAYCLAVMQRDAAHVVPALEAMLGDNDQTVRAAAALALAHLGSRARPALTSLEDVAHFDPPPTCDRAAWAVAEIESTAWVIADQSAGEWQESESDNEIQRPGASDTDQSAATGPETAEAVLDLIKRVNLDRPDVPIESIWAIGKLGPEAKDAVPVLETIVHLPSQPHRLAAIAALKRIAPPLGESLRIDFGVYAPMWCQREWITHNHALDHPRDLPTPDVTQQLVRDITRQVSHSPSVAAELGPAAATEKAQLREIVTHGTRIQAAAAMRVLLNCHPLDQAESSDLVRALQFLGTRPIATAELARRDLTADLPAIQQLLDHPDETQVLQRVCAARVLWLANRSPDAVEYLVRQVSHPDAFVSQAAVEFLLPTGPAAVGATEALIQRLEVEGDLYDPLVPIEAAETLAAIGPEAVAAAPKLQQLIRGENTIRRVAAIRALASIAPASEVVQTLKPLCLDPGPIVRQAVFEALASRAAESTEAVPWMVQICQHEAQRRAATGREGTQAAVGRIRTLGGLGPAALAAEPYLLDEIRFGANNEVKAEAILALRQITGAGITLPWLLDLLSDPAPHRAPIYGVLSRMGASARHAIPDLVRAINRAPDADGWAAIETIPHLGPDREIAVPAIRNQLHSHDKRVVASAASALWEMGYHEELVPWLLHALQDSPKAQANNRKYVACVLGRLGSRAKEATARLEEVIYDADREVAQAAAAALHAIAPETAAQHGITSRLLETYPSAGS